MHIRTIRLAGWSLVMVATGIVVAVVVAAASRSGHPLASDPLRTSRTLEDTTLFVLGEEVALPDIPGDAWAIHPRIHGASDVTPAGDEWAVLDARGHEVHILDAELRLLETLGGPGEGPGELNGPAAVAVSAEGLVGVVDLTGATVDLFDMEGRFVDRLRPDPRPCPAAGVVRDLLPHPEAGFVIDIDCTGMSGREWVIATVGVEGDVSRLAVTPLGDPLQAVLHGGRGVAFRDDRVWLATPDGCLGPPDPEAPHPGGEAVARHLPMLCLPVTEPVAIPDSLREELRTVLRARDGRPELELPTHFPPVLAVDWSPVGPVFTMPPDPDSGALAILSRDGTLWRVKGVGRAHPGRDALLLVRTFMEGTGFHAIPWTDLFGPGGVGRGSAPEPGSGREVWP